MKSYKEKCEELRSIMMRYTKNNIVIAYSGGVDSSLLLRLACECALKNRSKVYAVTLHTMLHPMVEVSSAQKIAEELGAIHSVLKIDELESAGIMNNPTDRCYLCKQCLFKQLVQKAKKLNVDIIIEGTNADDLNVYRPGIRAVKELGVISPLADVGMTKAEVRQLAGEYGMAVSGKPSTPCLATRFPYGTQLSYDKMRKVENGEEFIKTLGVYNVRLRVHEDIARIEVDEQDIPKVLEYRKEITSYLKSLGYLYITIDLEGFRSGSMDINIQI